MKKIIISVFIIVAVSVSVFGQSSDKKSDKTSKSKEEVTSLTNKAVDALVKKDVAVLERILAEDFLDISPSGLPSTKNLVIEYFKANAGKPALLDGIDLKYLTVNLYDNTAVVRTIVILNWKGSQAEKDEYYVTMVAVKKKDIWQIVATQEGPVIKGKPTPTN